MSYPSPRTYNQIQKPRPFMPGKRRFSVYWTWSYPWEAGRDITEMDNRFSTMTEVRRVLWPFYETVEYSEKMFLQGIAGTLELFHLSIVRFQQVIETVTGHPVPDYQRIDQAGQRLLIDERILADTDTLMVFGLDHLVTEQEALPEEIEAIKQFLKREGTCLILSPHHDVGFSEDLNQRQQEYKHHGDEALNKQMDLDKRGWLNGVNTFNFHMHLPHYAVTTDDPKLIHVLASQPIDMTHPHPFIEAGNTEFNMFLWMPPNEERAGDILLADSTIFTTLFGGDESLERFWKNLATL
jgi:hypothetical protein